MNANQNAYPVPAGEMDRLLNLSDLNVDYAGFENNFKDLAKLAARLTGTEISLVNLIDTYTQWTISFHGLELEQMPREESVCQYTIMQQDYFEVEDLSADSRFEDKFYVKDDPSLRYYYGIPLKSDGKAIGALCVLDKKAKKLAPEKTELLSIIGEEIVNRLKTYKLIEELKVKATEAVEARKRAAHDIRGPLAGIIGLSEVANDLGKGNIDKVLRFTDLIYKSSQSLLELADEILSQEKKTDPQAHELNLTTFKQKLEKLYQPQATSKGLVFTVTITPETATVLFLKNKLLQITGNLISNAIKFTPPGGSVTVYLKLAVTEQQKDLHITVADTGTGLDKNSIDRIMQGTAASTNGTAGEQGYGFGLSLVKHLVETLGGSFTVSSEPGKGASFEVLLPL